MHEFLLWGGVAACLSVFAAAAAQDDVPLDTRGKQDQPAYMAPKVDRSLLLDGAVVGDRLFVVGEHGHIIVSDDQGKTWTQVASPTRSALTGVFFHDANNGYAVGHDAVILRTTDGGATWQKVHFDPGAQTPLLDVHFVNAERGFAVGAYGLFLATSDGGANWQRRPMFSQKLPADAGADVGAEGESAVDDVDEEDDFVDPEFGEDFHLNHLTQAADGKLYIAAEAGRLYRSDDGGEVWFRIPTPYVGSYFATVPLVGGSLLLLGMRGHLFYSENHGEDLRALDSKTDALLTSGFAGDDNRVLLAGLAGVVLESTDRGQTFTLYRQEDRKGNMMILPASSSSIVLIGEAGVKQLTSEQYQAGGH